LIDTLSYAEVNFATALVPSDIACLASSPGKVSRTAVCISRDVSVFVLLIFASLLASVASLSKMSLMNEFMMFMALLDIPVSECTCFRTLKIYKDSRLNKAPSIDETGLTVLDISKGLSKADFLAC
jgi:hypothetical protein